MEHSDKPGTASGPEGPSRAARLASDWGPIALALLLGTIGALTANHFNMPLAWLLGPLLVCAAAGLAGLPVKPLSGTREAGQLVIGAAIGLRMTPAVLATTAGLVPAMVLGTVYVIGLTTVAAFALQYLAGVDRKTAFFATAAAGMSEMAITAQSLGGDPRIVSVVHAIRVGFVVLVIPPLIFAFGHEGGFHPMAGVRTGSAIEIALLLAAGWGFVFVTSWLRFPSPWFTGPLLAGIAAAAILPPKNMPWLLFVSAQIVLGISLGCRFDRQLLRRLPRVVASALLTSAILIAGAAMGAAGLSVATTLPFETTFLAIAPASAAEMVLTAGVMHLDTATVTAFHIVRIALINVTALAVFKMFERLALRFGPRS
jgi:uncharacterized protein